MLLVQGGPNLPIGVGCQPAFWSSGGFNSAEEALAEIEKRRGEKEDTIRSIAELSFAYEGALDYEKLKSYPQREIEILVETMNRINKKKEKAYADARKGKSATSGTIGDFEVS